MSIVTVNGLYKHYPSFSLKDVSFSLEAGRITGFIGRNGAGKTTVIKIMTGLVRPDAGEVRYFGRLFSGSEAEVKRRIGYSAGAGCPYPRKELRKIAAVTRSFYPDWDESAYRRCLELFRLDERKAPAQLSEGMKVKWELAIALSHRAEVLILDEPTGRLDPFSRDEVLRILTDLKRDGVAILFSTHIVSDLEKCADDIVYLRNGCVAAALPLSELSKGLSYPGKTTEETFLRLEREGNV